MFLRTSILSLLVAGSALADLTIEQKLESPYHNGLNTVRIKGNKVRSDSGTQITALIDVATGDSTNLMHEQKMIMKMSGAQMKANLEAMKKLSGQTGADPATAKVVSTGKHEKIGEYDCEIFSYSFAGGTSTMWIAKDYPNYPAFKAELESLSKMSPITIDTSAVNGMLIKNVVEAGGIKTTTTLISVKQAPLDESIFAIPAGYKEAQ